MASRPLNILPPAIGAAVGFGDGVVLKKLGQGSHPWVPTLYRVGVMSVGLLGELLLAGTLSYNLDYSLMTAAATLLGGQAGGALAGGAWKPGAAYAVPAHRETPTYRAMVPGCSSCGQVEVTKGGDLAIPLRRSAGQASDRFGSSPVGARF